MSPPASYHPMKRTMIAPCGMNCAVCYAHLRTKNQCPGCRSAAAELPHYCSVCIMRNCRVTNGSGERYCTSCSDFPCKRMRQLDKRYRTRYGVSLIDNLREIETVGIRTFLLNESVRWLCPQCGAVRSIHRSACTCCGTHYHPSRESE
jgi:hypothetical protein